MGNWREKQHKNKHTLLNSNCGKKASSDLWPTTLVTLFPGIGTQAQTYFTWYHRNKNDGTITLLKDDTLWCRGNGMEWAHIKWQSFILSLYFLLFDKIDTKSIHKYIHSSLLIWNSISMVAFHVFVCKRKPIAIYAKMPLCHIAKTTRILRCVVILFFYFDVFRCITRSQIKKSNTYFEIFQFSTQKNERRKVLYTHFFVYFCQRISNEYYNNKTWM